MLSVDDGLILWLQKKRIQRGFLHTNTARLESFQDFLMKLDKKARMHLVEISIFSLNNITVGPIKILNRADKN